MVDVITMGEALIDFVPKQIDCPLSEVSDFKRAPGGAPANVAVGVARLGVRSGFIGKVGKDAFGIFLKNTLKQNDVDITQMKLSDEAMTTLAFVSLTGDGERDFAFYRNPGADTLYYEEEMDFQYLKNARIFHFGSISLIKDPAKNTTIKLIEQARKKGLLISFDPNIRLPLWGTIEQAKNEIKRVIPLTDFLKVNGDEIKIIAGIKDLSEKDLIKACKSIMILGPKLIIVTLGAKGCFYYTTKDYGFIDGICVKTTDTTGAGDSFVAAILSQLININQINLITLKKDKLIKILKFANKVASITTTRNGGIPSLPYLNEVIEYL